MKQKIIMPFMAFIAISASTASLQAASLTSTYQVLSQQQSVNGFDTTIALTLNNTGTTTLSGLTLTAMEPISATSADQFSIGSIPAGGNNSVQWTMILPAPDFPLLMLDVADTNANGVVNYTPLISEVQ